MKQKLETEHPNGTYTTRVEPHSIEGYDSSQQIYFKELNSPSQNLEQRKCISVHYFQSPNNACSHNALDGIKHSKNTEKRSKTSKEFKKNCIRIAALTLLALVNANFLINLELEEFEARYQHHYRTNLESNVKRGLNIINAWSGCNIAAWVYNTNYAKGDCKDESQRSKRIYGQQAIDRMRDGDTIYVPFTSLNDFAMRILPKVKTKFVLITSELDYHIETVSKSIQNVSLPRILDHPKLLHWFSRDIGLMLGITPNSIGFNKKISSFPVGLKPNRPWSKKMRLNPIPTYQKAFVDLTPQIKEKTNFLFFGYIQRYNSVKSRDQVPQGERLWYPNYLGKIAESQYIVSPNGKKPDCHRHYEAIGLATVPITELDPVYYRHVKDSPFVFGNTEWEIDKLTEKMSKRELLFNMSVRNMVFEEYYMEYIEDVVGRPLRWWDIHQGSWSMMKDFVDVPISFWNETIHRSLDETLSILLDS